MRRAALSIRLILRSGLKRVYARLQRAMAASRRMKAARASWFETRFALLTMRVEI
jgi:hypothetical protein